MALKIHGNLSEKAKEACIEIAGRLFWQAQYEASICYAEKKKFQKDQPCNMEDVDFWNMVQKAAEEVAIESGLTGNFILYWEE